MDKLAYEQARSVLGEEVADKMFGIGHVVVTKRELFAAMAMEIGMRIEEERPTHKGPSYQGAAERAVFMADALIAALKESAHG